MFPSYIFCSLNNDTFNVIVNSNCVVNRLKVDEPYERILIGELKSIRELEEHSSELEITIRPEIVKGRKIVVTGGPLKGFSGIVEKRKNRALVTVNLEILGQSVSAEIDIEFVEPEEE
jgi:transcription antitermination factor NusG